MKWGRTGLRATGCYFVASVMQDVAGLSLFQLYTVYFGLFLMVEDWKG